VKRYVLVRLVEGLFSLFVVTVFVFVLSRATGDPVLLMLPQEATPQEIASMRAKLGVDRPVYVQYAFFVGNALRGDFGRSIQWDEPCGSLFLERFRNTLQLALAALVLAIGLGIPAGVFSAVKRGRLTDKLVTGLAVLGQSLPVFWSGLMLILVFAVQLHWLPTSGKGGLEHVVLPAVALAGFFAAAEARVTRSSMLDVLASPYVTMARIKGVPESAVVWKHALRNALLPVVTVASTSLITLLNGTVVTEIVFAWPGVGRLTVDAIFARDFPVLQTNVLFLCALVILVNLSVDILYGYLDPRLKHR
jgi:ABC-type dipeptide/oligopeptide/nickel transport system permease component